MGYRIIIIIALIFSISCSNDSNSPKKNINTFANGDNGSKFIEKKILFTKDSSALKTTILNEIHLKDTLKVRGNYIVFFRPDSLRFHNYSKDPHSGIYEADSDFGFGISSAIHSLTNQKKYSNIKSVVSNFRYTLILDGENGEVLIDRDSMDYGYLLTKTMQNYKYQSLDQNIISSGDYFLKQVDDYFNIKK